MNIFLKKTNFYKHLKKLLMNKYVFYKEETKDYLANE